MGKLYILLHYSTCIGQTFPYLQTIRTFQKQAHMVMSLNALTLALLQPDHQAVALSSRKEDYTLAQFPFL